jgi:hypothetical protein
MAEGRQGQLGVVLSQEAASGGGEGCAIRRSVLVGQAHLPDPANAGHSIMAKLVCL